MSETKTIIYPEGGNFGGSGIEGMLLGSAMNGGGFGGGMNNPFWAIILLAFLRNGGLWNGGENNCQLSQIQDTLNTNQGNTLLMDAIKGNAGAIRDLAGVIGCNHNAVIAAINGVQSAICNVGNQVGMSSAQVINAIQNGNMQLANTLQSCCCDVKQLVTTQGFENRLNNERQSQLIQNGFSQIGYANAEQTCAVKQAISDQTLAVLNKLDAQEDARKDREIAALTAQLATVNARAGRQAELAPIVQKLNDIACKQPSTTTIPYSPVVGVPSCVAWNAGLYGLNGYGYNGGNFG